MICGSSSVFFESARDLSNLFMFYEIHGVTRVLVHASFMRVREKAATAQAGSFSLDKMTLGRIRGV